MQHPEIYQRLFEAAPDAIVVINDSGNILHVNATAETVFGYETGELNGLPIETLIPDRFRRQHVGHRAGYVAARGVRPMGIGLQLAGRQKCGAEFPVDIMLSPSTGESGNLTMAVIRDVSERKRFEKELHEKNAELEKASLAKDRFLASMSHELRTPLNAILGFTGTLLMRLPGPLTEDQDKQLSTIKTSAKHLLSLINDLLDLAKIESGKVERAFESVIAQNVLSDVADTMKPLAESKGLDFSIRTPSSDLTIQTDRRALSQILINLTNNAIKFTESGAVEVELVGTENKGRSVVEFRVRDTGIGIREDDQARLFQAFTQISGHSGEGTGLGLHLSRKLVELLGGEITFSSRLGLGSTFTLILPNQVD